MRVTADFAPRLQEIAIDARRREEGERGVVEHDVHDDGALWPRHGRWLVLTAQAAAGMQQHTILAAGKRLSEAVPVAPGFDPLLGGCGFRRQVQRKPAHQGAVGGVQLHRGCEPEPGEVRLTPDAERRVGRGRLTLHPHLCRHQLRQPRQPIDLVERGAELDLQLLAVRKGLRPERVADDALGRAVAQSHQRRVEDQGGHDQCQERREQPEDLRAVAIPRRHPSHQGRRGHSNDSGGQQWRVADERLPGRPHERRDTHGQQPERGSAKPCGPRAAQTYAMSGPRRAE